MGFFDDLFGSPAESTSGFGALPQEGQQAYKRISNGINRYATGASNIRRFTPMGATGDEKNAFSAMRGGFAPTLDSIKSDVSMLMNPYNKHVIDGIKRYTQGEHSNLQSYMQGMGQMGSSRDMVNATEADRMQGQLIGEFLQGQYDNAINQSLGRMTDLRQQDAQNLLGIGAFLRNLDLQTKQAPISMLNAASNILNQSGTSGAISSSGTQTGASGGLIGSLSEIGNLAAGLGMGYSSIMGEK